jgi:hypothetical protein
MAAARNTATPNGVLSLLACDADSTIRWAVAGNASASLHSLVALASDVDRDVRIAVAKTATLADVLAVVAADVDCVIRRRVSENPNAPVGLLAVLMCDSDFEVRALAAMAHRNLTLGTHYHT